MGELWGTLLLPAVLLLVGWLLNELTHDRREAENRKRRLRKSMAYLMSICHLMYRRRTLLEAMKEIVEGWDDFHMVRKRALDRFESEEAGMGDESQHTIDVVSEYFPFELQKIRMIINSLPRQQSLDFDWAITSSEEQFLKVLSANEAIDEAIESDLNTLLKKLSWKISPVTWFKMQFWLHDLYNPSEEKAENINATKEFLKTLFNDAKGKQPTL